MAKKSNALLLKMLKEKNKKGLCVVPEKEKREWDRNNS